MSDGKFRTLQEIYNVTGFSQASVSAQLRNARKQSFGGHTMNKRRRSELKGTFEYQIVLKK
jgi:DNA-binding transcriptional regulator GbsR (MarR family)